jgi:hypothetical protein
VLDSGNHSLDLASFIEELASHPDAPRWARDCRWIPGTGYCRNHPCRPGCLFRRQKEAEARSLTDARRQRRHPRFVDRLLSCILPFLCVGCLAALIEMF